MKQERLESTEARFALTISICLSVAIGYIALHRLGGTGDTPPLEERPSIEMLPDQGHASAEEDQPQVLPIDPQSPAVPSPQAPDHPEVVRRNADSPDKDGSDATPRSKLR
jgi:hypothetical protein